MEDAGFWILYVPLSFIGGLLLSVFFMEAYEGKISWLNRLWDAYYRAFMRCIRWVAGKYRDLCGKVHGKDDSKEPHP